MIATGRGANITAQVGEQGVLLVDAGTVDLAPQVLTAIRTLTSAPIRAIVNTTSDADHIGGNAVLAAGGQPMFAGSIGATSAPQAQIFAHERLLIRVSAPSGQTAPVAPALWPTDTFAGAKKKLYFNREPIELHHRPGHTDGDALVWFRRADVIAAGDAFGTTTFPVFDAARGGSIQGVLDGLNEIIDIAVAEFNQQGGTRIVPGHGRLANQSDVVEYRDMATIVRDRVRDAIGAGQSLAQIKAARFTLEYDGLYATPAYGGDMFVEAIYNDLATRK
jgi:glyoxylase-like metal-dependent hydrolase (beta-lactamase superfamily II)